MHNKQNEPFLIYSSSYFVHSGRNAPALLAYQHAKNMPNGQRVLFCTFDTHGAQRTRLVDRLAHLFVRDIHLSTHVFTHAKLARQALKAVESSEHAARV